SAQGKEAEAEAVFRDALAVQPTSTVLRVNLAHTLAAQDRHEDGLAEMLAVLEQVPGDNIAQIGVLRMLTDLGQVDKGIRYGTRWLGEKPEDQGLKAHLGVLYGKQSDLERAEPLLRESLTDDVPRQLVHKLLASIALARGDAEGGLAHLRREQQLLYQPELYDDTARILFSMQRWAEAADDFDVYLDAQPTDHAARREHAQAVYNTYDYELAAEILAPALAARPDDPDVLMMHANILAKIGDREEAEATAARANDLHRERLEAAGAVIAPETEP
ncbi:MAG: putative Zn-dependent protease, partial [Myxococcota bacterium]